MAITLNGVAQGYITDRVATLLRAEGLSNMLIHIGETRALGSNGDGVAWRVGVAGPDGVIERQLSVSDRALATSSPLGTVLDLRGRVGHIMDPASGETPSKWSTVAVSAPAAALADGLSTAFCLMERNAIEDCAGRLPGVAVELLV